MAHLHLHLHLHLHVRFTLLSICLAPLPLIAAATTTTDIDNAAMIVNITRIIESAGEFQTFVSLLAATGVDRVYQAQADSNATGVTIFAPTDRAFSAVSPSGTISSLPAHLKVTLLEFHALSAFYPLSALQQSTDPVTPTLATDYAGAGKFTVNVTNVDGTVFVSTGLSRAAIISTLYNSVPCGVFAVDQVLLPQEIFGRSVSPAPAPSVGAHLSPGPSAYIPYIPTDNTPSSSSSSSRPSPTVSSSPASPFAPTTNLSSSSSLSSSTSPSPQYTNSACSGLVVPQLLLITLMHFVIDSSNMDTMWLSCC